MSEPMQCRFLFDIGFGTCLLQYFAKRSIGILVSVLPFEQVYFGSIYLVVVTEQFQQFVREHYHPVFVTLSLLDMDEFSFRLARKLRIDFHPRHDP